MAPGSRTPLASPPPCGWPGDARGGGPAPDRRTPYSRTASATRGLYAREPNGVLYEIATDGPGFATDEPLEALGRMSSLPPLLGGRRAEIERGLKPIRQDAGGTVRAGPGGPS